MSNWMHKLMFGFLAASQLSAFEIAWAAEPNLSGKYVYRHKVEMFDSDSGEFVEKDGADSLLIKDQGTSGFSFDVTSVQTNGHTCGASGFAKAAGSDKYVAELDDGDPDELPPCRLEFRVSDEKIRITDSPAGSCQGLCGVRAGWVISFPRKEPPAVAAVASGTANLSSAPQPVVSGKQKFWNDFRQAFLAKDMKQLALLTSFPLQVVGHLDGDPTLRVGEKSFAKCFTFVFSEDVDLGTTPMTHLDYLTENDSLDRLMMNGKPIAKAPATSGFVVAKLVFGKAPHKLERIYLDTMDKAVRKVCRPD